MLHGHIGVLEDNLVCLGTTAVGKRNRLGFGLYTKLGCNRHEGDVTSPWSIRYSTSVTLVILMPNSTESAAARGSGCPTSKGGHASWNAAPPRPLSEKMDYRRTPGLDWIEL
jgi:hypothetical protein